ncbi:MAG: permease-like cell division protein FtsX [bacterium]
MIYFYISESIKSFNRAKLASLVTVFITSIAILLTITSLALVLVSKKINDYLKAQINVSVFLEDSLRQNEIHQIKLKLQDDINVKAVKYFDKDAAIKKFIEETGEDFRRILQINPLPASFVVQLKPEKINNRTLHDFASHVQRISGVSDVVYEDDLILRMLNFLFSFELMIYIAAFIAIVLSIYLVYSINKFITHTKAEQFNTMKLVGAKLKAIRIPIIVNGIIIGIISGLLCALCYNLGLLILNKIYHNINFTKWYYLINVTTLILGIMFGFLGSLLSARKINLKIESF